MLDFGSVILALQMEAEEKEQQRREEEEQRMRYLEERQ